MSVEVDVGGLVDNVVDTGKKFVGAIQDVGECLFGWL